MVDEIRAFYDRGEEQERLSAGGDTIELMRTRELLLLYLPPPPATELDVGGGAGVYAAWLAQRGYRVHLVDPVPLHVEQARAAAAAQPEAPFTAAIGDARRLNEADASTDAVLFLGPLYHLTEREDRLAALREARRVLRPGGRLLAAGISRFASLLDGLCAGWLDTPSFANIVAQDLRDGQHRNPEHHPAWFTTAFFHHPDELAAEVRGPGLILEALLGIEGPGWLLDAGWEDRTRRGAILYAARAVEREPSLLGLSAHLLAVGRRID